MTNTIKKILHRINSESVNRITGFVIGNTANVFKPSSFYPIPIRITDRIIYGGVIVNSYDIAKKIAAMVDGQVDYIFIDAESKIKKNIRDNDQDNNIETATRKIISKSTIITYKGNDLAAETVDFMLSQLIHSVYGSNVAIIGCGNLGSKIALKLVERGAHVKVYRRDSKNLKKIVAGLNQIKSKYTPATIKLSNNITGACRNADAIIATATSQNLVDKKHLAHFKGGKSPVLIDVGKGCFSKNLSNSNNHNIYRADISIVQKKYFSALIETRLHYSKSIGRRTLTDKKIGDIHLASLGLLGRNGEVIVDDINKPSQIIGIADGKGSLIKNTDKYRKILDKVSSLLNLNSI